MFVSESLSAVEEFMCNLFQREIETLETLLERRNKLLDLVLQPRRGGTGVYGATRAHLLENDHTSCKKYSGI